MSSVFRTEELGIRTRFSSREFPEESLMLTGDLNVADVRWTVQYRIIDPVRYLFSNRNPAKALRDAEQIAMRTVVGDYTVTGVLTESRLEIAAKAQEKTQELLDLYQTGLRVETVQMQNVTPPSDDVKRAFNEVNEAQQEKASKINEALQVYNQEVPRARGEAERTLAKAEGYAVKRVHTARGDVARFKALLAEYRKAPDVPRRRPYLETMPAILPAVRQAFVFDAEQDASWLPLLNLQPGDGLPHTSGASDASVTQARGEKRCTAPACPLHLKVPFIQTVRRFDKRVLEWDGSTEQIPTLDKRFILLDTTVRRRIAEPLRFLQAVGNERSAQSRLDDLLESAARDIVSGHLLIQEVRNFARELPVEYLEERAADSEQQTLVPLPDSLGALEAQPEADIRPSPIEDLTPSERLGRDKLTALMVERARKNLPNLGIELIDVRIKRINYVTEVEQKVYERMISERQRIAARFRSEGDGASAKIQGGKERDLDRMRSEAYCQAQDIIGQGDAEAARIYAEAYGADAEFYTFLQTLETYKQTLQGNANLLLTTDSDFYRYLKEVKFDGTMP